jgi:CHASE2 domain-containing sensor protein
MTESNPIAEPKKPQSRGKKIRDGLFLLVIGAAGFILFLVIDSAAHVRILPLAGITILIALAGIAWIVMALAGDDKPQN